MTKRRAEPLAARASSEEDEAREMPDRAEREKLVLDLGAVGGGKCSFELRRSARARHLRLIVGSGGLTVVVPAGLVSLRKIERLIEPHKAWIRKNLERMELLSSAQPRRQAVSVPGRIVLRALEETWRVELSDSAPQRTLARDGVVRLPRDFCRGEALAALRRWVLLRAREVLPRLLTELAAEHGFEVGRIAVREMKSRWGSCSSRGNISLNARLLFLSSGLVRHVLLHELCHLREMNHSRAFYECLRDVDPEADRHAGELRAAWRMVPPWACT